MSVVKRIKEYLYFKGITNQKFEITIGYSNGAFGSQLKNDKAIGSDKLENILKEYNDINPEWLLTGKGEMLKETFNLKPTAYLHDNVEEEKSDNEYIIEIQKKLIEKLEKEVKELQEQLENKTKV